MIKQEFWCHLCSMKFPSTAIPGQHNVNCPKCHQQFTQVNSKTNKPEKYQPYQKTRKNHKIHSYVNSRTLRITNNQLSQIIEVENQNYEISDQMLDSLRYKVSFKCECVVCKQQLQINEQALMPECKHIFHEDCLVHWLKKKNSCPTCRTKILKL